MNTGKLSAEQKTFSREVTIKAPAAEVWQTLTTPEVMNQWMMPDAKLEILTEWQVGGPIVIRGHMNGKEFENRGTVVQFEPDKALQYTHLSSISRLPDRPESYSLFAFSLKPSGNQTILGLTVRNFPNESIYKHLAFYWNVTLEIIKRRLEGQE